MVYKKKKSNETRTLQDVEMGAGLDEGMDTLGVLHHLGRPQHVVHIPRQGSREPKFRPPNQFRPPQIFLSSCTLKGKRREETRTGH